MGMFEFILGLQTILAILVIIIKVNDILEKRKDPEHPTKKGMLYIYWLIILLTLVTPVLTYLYQRNTIKASQLENFIEESLRNFSPEDQKKMVEGVSSIKEELNRMNRNQTPLPKRDKAIKLFFIGHEALLRGDSERAVFNFDLSLGCIETGVVHIFKGLAIEGKEPDKAIREYRRGVEMNPNYEIGHLNLGHALLMRGDSLEAEKESRLAIQIKPDYAIAYINLGNALYAQKRFLEAEKALNEAIRIKPDEPDAHYGLGLVLVDQGRFSEAEQQFQEATNLRPEDPDAIQGLGIALHKLGRNEESQEYLKKALKLEQDPIKTKHIQNLLEAWK